MKAILGISILLSMFMLTGCETTKGLAEGTAITAYGTASGAVKDTVGFYEAMKKADKWFQENYW